MAITAAIESKSPASLIRCSLSKVGSKDTQRVSKNIPNIFDSNFKQDYRILIKFSMNISETTCDEMNVRFSTSAKVCLCTTWGKQNQQNIAFLPNAVLLLNSHNAQKHILLTFLTLWLTFY